MKLQGSDEIKNERRLRKLFKERPKMCLLTVDIKPFRQYIKGKRVDGKEFQRLTVQENNVDINILVTSRNNRKIVHSIRITRGPPTRIRKRYQLSQFGWKYTKVIGHPLIHPV